MSKKIGGLCCDLSYVLFLAAGTLYPIVRRDKRAGERLTQTAATLLVTAVAVQALKLLVPERRPDTGQRGSFPSGHSTNTIALATVCGAQEPRTAAAWCLAAVGISLSRLALRRHRLRDVVAGSLLGQVTARSVIRWTDSAAGSRRN